MYNVVHVNGWYNTQGFIQRGGRSLWGTATASCMSKKFSSFEEETTRFFKFSGGGGGDSRPHTLCMKPWYMYKCVIWWWQLWDRKDCWQMSYRSSQPAHKGWFTSVQCNYSMNAKHGFSVNCHQRVNILFELKLAYIAVLGICFGEVCCYVAHSRAIDLRLSVAF